MNGFRTTAAVASLALALAPAALAYDVNKDLQNLGPGAAGVVVVLSGAETVTSTYDGYSSGPWQGTFGSPTTSTTGSGDTQIAWSGFNDGGNNVIDTNQVFHVGWSTADGTCSIKDMYFVDAAGNRIPGSKIENITPTLSSDAALGTVAQWTNNNSFAPVFLSDIRIEIELVQLSLSSLNSLNPELMQQLQPIFPQTIPLSPGQQFHLPLGPPLPPGTNVVMMFRVNGPRSATSAIDFIQWTVPGAQPCPGDADGDGDVDQDDMDLVLFNFGTLQPPGTNGDVTGEGFVDQDDLDLVLFNFGIRCP